jgi:ferredoxin-NADP reductase
MEKLKTLGSSLDHLKVVVRSMTLLAKDTLAVELTPENGVELPLFAAGAHVDIRLPSGASRSYSLCNPPDERQRYVIGVKRAVPSREASSYIHDHLRVGQSILISVPRNNFQLDGGARMSIFIAGGIGITPIRSMIHKLERDRHAWKLFYAARTRKDAAFYDELEALEAACPGRVDIRLDHEPGTGMLNLEQIVSQHSGSGVHFYSCGPEPMLDAFELATKHLPSAQCHLERFNAELKPSSRQSLANYEVFLARSGVTLQIGPEMSILDKILDANINIDFSCMGGVCGSCAVAVIEGVPDHRDHVLTDEERAINNKMLVCCSGSCSERLVLDV